MNLSDAAKQGNKQAVTDAIESGATVDLQFLLRKVYQDYHTIRKHSGHLELAKLLLSAGASPEKELLCEAARGGHAFLIQCLLESGLKADLFAAAAMGDTEKVRYYLSQSPACAREKDSFDMTPLHYCCASTLWKESQHLNSSFLATSLLLLESGADVSATGSYYGLSGVTPLFYVAWTGGNVEIASALLNHGAEITQNTFLAAVGHFQRHGDGNYDVAAALLDHGFDINSTCERTALHAFAAHEDARGVSWLIDHGANVNSRDVDENTPLIAAARRNAGTKVLKLLVAAGATLSAVNKSGQDALGAAKSAGKKKAVEFLQNTADGS